MGMNFDEWTLLFMCMSMMLMYNHRHGYDFFDEWTLLFMLFIDEFMPAKHDFSILPVFR
jgi:hypothetical protein